MQSIRKGHVSCIHVGEETEVQGGLGNEVPDLPDLY